MDLRRPFRPGGGLVALLVLSLGLASCGRDGDRSGQASLMEPPRPCV